MLFSDATVDWQSLFIATPAVTTTDAVLSELYNFEGLTAIENYSDLHYQQAELNIGGTYRFTPNLYVAAQAGWQWFEDKTPYVYGDQDGTAYRGNIGLGYRF